MSVVFLKTVTVDYPSPPLLLTTDSMKHKGNSAISASANFPLLPIPHPLLLTHHIHVHALAGGKQWFFLQRLSLSGCPLHHHQD